MLGVAWCTVVATAVMPQQWSNAASFDQVGEIGVSALDVALFSDDAFAAAVTATRPDATVVRIARDVVSGGTGGTR